MTFISTMLFVTLLGQVGNSDRDGEVNVSKARTDQDGFLIHDVQSPYQKGTTLIRVLLPESDEERRYPVIYVLPVEASTENRYGDGLLEIKKLGLHRQLQAIFVAPTFSGLPWYADHPTNREIRQESYFQNVVVPFVDKTYPVKQEAKGRYLLGFSKSGWGAFSLLLRHPDIFQKAAAWDAPLMMDQPGKYGSGEIFGTPSNFEAYQISRLLKQNAKFLEVEKRLIVTGYGNFRSEHQSAHDLMNDLKIVHEYRDGPLRKHDWHSGWVEEAVRLLMAEN